jgi:dolichol kinase
MIAFILFILTIFFCLILNEIIFRKFHIPVSFSRKLVHIASSLIVFAMPFFLIKNEIIAIALFFAVLLFIARRKNIFSSVHSVTRKTLGEVFLPLGVAISAFFFLPKQILAFQFGILIMGISDAFASIIGEKFGRHIVKIFGHKKSFEGSFVFLVASIIIGMFFLGFDYWIIFLSIILTIIELFLVLGLDNLILPTAAALLFIFH